MMHDKIQELEIGLENSNTVREKEVLRNEIIGKCFQRLK
jgi:hypothetical protein